MHYDDRAGVLWVAVVGCWVVLVFLTFRTQARALRWHPHGDTIISGRPGVFLLTHVQTWLYTATYLNTEQTGRMQIHDDGN